MLRTASVALLVTLGALPGGAQSDHARLTLNVVEEETGQPIANATVEVPGVDRPGRTNRNGVWQGERLPAGSRIVRVSRIGYGTGRFAVELAAGSGVERTVALRPAVVEVEGVEATAARRSPTLERRGFYGRQRRGHGAYMTHEVIERLRPMRTVDLFYHMRGFTVLRDRLGHPYLATTRGNPGLGRECAAPLIYLDGTMLSWGPNRFNSRGGGPLESINPESIAAIEAYAGAATIPDEYRQPGAVCGVVLIWTKTGDEG